MNQILFELKPAIKVVYTDAEGTVATRTIMPRGMWFGRISSHAEEEWLIRAFALDTNKVEIFSLKNMTPC
jgi:hypothetical protein